MTQAQQNQTLSFIQWEDALTEAVEDYGVDRSDAQGIIEAEGSAIRDYYEQGKTVRDACILVMGWPDGRTHEIRSGAQVLLSGDQSSISVIFKNLIGANFDDKPHEHTPYLAMMSKQLDCALLPDTELAMYRVLHDSPLQVGRIQKLANA